MRISTENCEFKEFEIGDHIFHGNCFWKKIGSREAEIVSSINVDEIGVVKTFTGNCLVMIVID